MPAFDLKAALKQAEAEGRVSSTKPVKLPPAEEPLVGPTSGSYNPHGRTDLSLALPFPPSVNHYWRHVGHKVLISAEGRRFRKEVADCIPPMVAMAGRLSITVEVFPPDRRRRDLDNLNKALLDAMQSAGVYEDDEQIDELTIRRRKVVRGGMVRVQLLQIGDGIPD